MGRDRTQDLRDILRIRKLQERAGELSLIRAARALEQENARQAEAQHTLAEREEAWRSAAAGRLDPVLALSWGQAVMRGAADLARVSEEVAGAERERTHRAQNLHLAQACTEAAKRLHRAARRAAGRTVEAKRLGALEDRVAGMMHED